MDIDRRILRYAQLSFIREGQLSPPIFRRIRWGAADAASNGQCKQNWQGHAKEVFAPIAHFSTRCFQELNRGAAFPTRKGRPETHLPGYGRLKNGVESHESSSESSRGTPQKLILHDQGQARLRFFSYLGEQPTQPEM